MSLVAVLEDPREKVKADNITVCIQAGIEIEEDEVDLEEGEVDLEEVPVIEEAVEGLVEVIEVDLEVVEEDRVQEHAADLRERWPAQRRRQTSTGPSPSGITAMRS